MDSCPIPKLPNVRLRKAKEPIVLFPRQLSIRSGTGSKKKKFNLNLYNQMRKEIIKKTFLPIFLDVDNPWPNELTWCLLSKHTLLDPFFQENDSSVKKEKLLPSSLL